MHQILRLDGQHCSAVIEFDVGKVPVWRHFGERLGSVPLMQAWPASALRRLPPGTMDRLGGAPLLSCFGNGQQQLPGLRCHRDGQNAIQELVAESFTQTSSGSLQTLVLHLRDNTRQANDGLSATISLSLHSECDVLGLQTTLHNTGSAIVQVDHLTASVTLPPTLKDVGYFSGQWAHEFQWHRRAVGESGWQQQNRHGRSSHEAPPACFLMTAHTSDHAGQVVGAQLAWSGNHTFAVDAHHDGSLTLQAGEWLAPGEVRLSPGESVACPPLLVTWSGKGINGATANFHHYARHHVLRWPASGMPARQVHLNTWEAVYFKHDESVLRELANQASALGIERFVLDDGWFSGRPDDQSGLGDWWPDSQKYPHGLGPLIDHVLSLGLSFGLWVEPEMVNPNSDLFRTHPQWALQTSGRELQFGRQQLVLDVANPEVADYLFEKLDGLLTSNAITYLKWDMNRDLAQAQDATGRMAYRRQVQALYELLARIRQAHPNVEIESCASGGGRMDLGVLEHTQRFWTSDNNDAVSRVKIQSGAARCFPLEILGAHVGPAPAHSTGRAQSMDFRCAVACFGHMGVEADLRRLSNADRATLARWIEFYKAWRGVLHTGIYHQGITANGVWWMVHTATRAVLGVFTLEPPATLHHANIQLHGLSDFSNSSRSAVTPAVDGTGVGAKERRWRVRLAGQAGLERARHSAAALWLDELTREGVVCSEGELTQSGLPVPNMNPESALVFTLDILME